MIRIHVFVDEDCINPGLITDPADFNTIIEQALFKRGFTDHVVKNDVIIVYLNETEIYLQPPKELQDIRTKFNNGFFISPFSFDIMLSSADYSYICHVFSENIYSVEIPVTKKHLDEGETGSYEKCPVALALYDYGFRDIIVDLRYIYCRWHDIPMHIEVNQILRELMKSTDNSHLVEPYSFKLLKLDQRHCYITLVTGKYGEGFQHPNKASHKQDILNSIGLYEKGKE